MATRVELYIDALGGLALDGSTDKNLPYFIVENLAILGGSRDPCRGRDNFWEAGISRSIVKYGKYPASAKAIR